MKAIICFLSAIVMVANINAQAIKDKQYVDKLCGCFEVEFKYAETFSPDKNYKFHDREEISGGTELTFPVEVSDKKIVMQHLLVITDSMIIKHWRENWTYEDPILWKYQGDKVWTKETLKPEQVKGKWTQSVWEVSDAPRYSGNSEWVTTDNKTFWQNATDAPLPRREYSVRNDYNILRRGNRLILNDSGYVHEQDNQKIIRKDGADKLLAEEKGINSYVKVNDKNCAAAKAWWEKNKEYWTKVRITWEKYLATHNTVALKDKVDGKVMHESLMDMAADYAAGKISSADIDGRIKTSFDKYVGDNKDLAQTK
ncbi:MAG: hypothetical protein QM764_17535 [Chitinophagaceae bacterium]